VNVTADVPDGSTQTVLTRPEPVTITVSEPWEPGFAFLDDFEVEGVLGQGGMGVVYRARQLSTGRALAVKRARLAQADGRRRFLAELQLWIDLPPHPHLAPCRFFRTVADEVVIFTDLAEGGSLADGIVQGRFGRVEERLDVAIQVAWGLHALHERGLVHQDVKPANVLLNAPGTAQVADFGVARARARVLSTDPTAGAQSVLFSSGAMTPGYCSPEQAARRPVSRKTDVWSWGVLVLEMFVGRVPCCDRGGEKAAEVLAGHLATPHALPDGLIEVLNRCFREAPAERWASLDEVAEVLLRVYRERAGHSYPRRAPGPGLAPLGSAVVPPWREAAVLGGWEPARKWLTLAYQAAGRDPTEVESALPPAATSRRAQTVADLAVYDEARQILEGLANAGRREVLAQLAGLYVQKARVHVSANDWPAALELYDRSLGLWQDLIHRGRRELTPNRVRTQLHKAEALRSLGDNAGAIRLCDEVIALWNRLDNRRARQDLRGDLAAAQFSKGVALRTLGQPRQALGLFEQAVALYEPLVEHGHDDLANDLAAAYLAQAGALAATGESCKALECCDRAIAIRKRLVQRQDHPELAGDLARAFLHKATVLRGQDNGLAALSLCEQAVALYERLVEQEGRDDLAHDLARAWLARASAGRALDRPGDAASCCAKAAAIWERLVQQEGRNELLPDLARAWQHRATALRAAGSASEALHWSDQAVRLLKRLMEEEGRQEVANELARAWVGQAGILRALNRRKQARERFEQAEKLRQRLQEKGPREDVEGDRVRDRVGWLELMAEMGDRKGARQQLPAAIERLEEMLAKTGRSDLRSALNRARRLGQRLGERG
jgi:tetratricopeptide (TPR) repeat protein